MHYSALKSKIIEYANKSENAEVLLSKSLFDYLVEAALNSVEVDEAWYITRYDDVRDAIARSKVVSPRVHYIKNGYFENRMPFAIKVDEEYYLKANPDVGAGIKSGEFKSAQEHFERSGFAEGREPHSGFKVF